MSGWCRFGCAVLVSATLVGSACKSEQTPAAPDQRAQGEVGATDRGSPRPADDARAVGDGGVTTAATVRDAASPPIALAPASEPTAATAGLTRVVVVHAGQLLRSEGRALAKLKRALTKSRGHEVNLIEVTAGAEASAARRTLGAAALDELPVAWHEAEAVVILEILAPTGEKPRRVSSGINRMAVLRPPQLEPIYRERLAEGAGSLLGDGLLETALGELLDLSDSESD